MSSCDSSTDKITFSKLIEHSETEEERVKALLNNMKWQPKNYHRNEMCMENKRLLTVLEFNKDIEKWESVWGTVVPNNGPGVYLKNADVVCTGCGGVMVYGIPSLKSYQSYERVSLNGAAGDIYTKKKKGEESDDSDDSDK